jgi:hypothetical protein
MNNQFFFFSLSFCCNIFFTYWSNMFSMTEVSLQKVTGQEKKKSLTTWAVSISSPQQWHMPSRSNSSAAIVSSERKLNKGISQQNFNQTTIRNPKTRCGSNEIQKPLWFVPHEYNPWLMVPRYVCSVYNTYFNFHILSQGINAGVYQLGILTHHFCGLLQEV